MGKDQIGKLPKLGDITVPVHLMHYDEKKNSKKHFSSGFAFWKAADGTSDVSDDEGNQVGSIGGTMGGHVEMSRYFPHNGKSYEMGKYEQWTSVIIDVRDIWEEIEKLIKTENVKVQLDGMEEIFAKYQALREKEKIEEEKKQKKLEEIKQMQKEAEEEAERKLKESEEKAAKEAEEEAERKKLLEPVIILKPGDKGYEGSKWDLESRFGTVHGSYKIKDTEILEDGNWDLTEGLDARDIDFYEYKNQEGVKANRDSNGKIPLNIGYNTLFVDTRYNKREVLYTDPKNPGGHDAEVTLDITSYVGISPGAIHSYGSLKFNTPRVHPAGQPNTSTSCWDLPLYGTGRIQLTRILESWEFKKYKGTYDGWRAGDSYSGFYKEEDIIERAKIVFSDLFGEGWILKIE